MRILALTTAVGLMLSCQAGHSQEKAPADVGAARPAKLSPAEQAAHSAAIAKEARDKADALERARDRRMKDISKGICTGC